MIALPWEAVKQAKRMFKSWAPAYHVRVSVVHFRFETCESEHKQNSLELMPINSHHYFWINIIALLYELSTIYSGSDQMSHFCYHYFCYSQSTTDVSKIGPIKAVCPEHIDYWHIGMVIAILQIKYGMPVEVDSSSGSTPTSRLSQFSRTSASNSRVSPPTSQVWYFVILPPLNRRRNLYYNVYRVVAFYQTLTYLNVSCYM